MKLWPLRAATRAGQNAMATQMIKKRIDPSHQFMPYLRDSGRCRGESTPLRRWPLGGHQRMRRTARLGALPSAAQREQAAHHQVDACDQEDGDSEPAAVVAQPEVEATGDVRGAGGAD